MERRCQTSRSALKNFPEDLATQLLLIPRGVCLWGPHMHPSWGLAASTWGKERAAPFHGGEVSWHSGGQTVAWAGAALVSCFRPRYWHLGSDVGPIITITFKRSKSIHMQLPEANPLNFACSWGPVFHPTSCPWACLWTENPAEATENFAQGFFYFLFFEVSTAYFNLSVLQ